MMRRLRFLPVLPLVGLFVSSASARAETAPLPAVDLVLAGDPAAAAAVEQVVRELLSRLGVTLRCSRADAFEPAAVVYLALEAPVAVARAWIDLQASSGPDGVGEATLYLADSAWERIRIRRVRLEAGVDEMAREELAHMLASGVAGLLAGAPLEQTREEVRESLALPLAPTSPPPLEPPPSPAPPVETPAPPPLDPEEEPPRALALDLGPGYDLAGFSDDAAVTHGPLIELALALPAVPLRPGLRLSAQYRLPIDVDGQPIGLELDQWSLRALVGIDVPLADGLAFTAVLGGGIDVVSVSTTLAAGATAVLEPASTDVLAVASAGVGLELRLFGTTRLRLTVGCDVGELHRTYVVRQNGLTRVLLESWIAQPHLLLTLATDLLGLE